MVPSVDAGLPGGEGSLILLGGHEIIIQNLILEAQAADAEGSELTLEDVQLRHLIGGGVQVVGDNQGIVDHIALGSGISGTWANAISAADMIEADHPEADIRVIDSTLASVGYGMLAILAADLRDCGSSADDCQAELEKVKGNINTYYTTGDLTYLYRSGRVSRTGMTIAHALNIWPILNLDLDGHLIVQAKERGKKRTIERIHKIINELCVDPEDQTLYICHSDIAEEAEQFGEEIKEKFGFRDVFYTYIGTTIGSNCGPGLMAAFFVGKKRTN